jgi:hypothetical protein
VTDVVAVDWSGRATGAAGHIWLGHAREGRLLELSNGRSRSELIAHLLHLKERCPDGIVVGFDFSFSFPAWFVSDRGHTTVEALWQEVARSGEEWLARCQPPFWGRPGKRRPPLDEPLRQTEAGAVVAGIGAKSTFQIGGAGAVGTGSVRGMPHLLELQRGGFSIWPFQPPSRCTVVEIYPRLLTGPVTKSRVECRADYLRVTDWPLTDEQRQRAVGSEDAFDAAISAIVMARHTEQLRGLPRVVDAITRLEGRVWDPHNITA